jgi:ketosteroid isomerase-like protein
MHDHTQTIRSLYQAFARRDDNAMAEILDPDIEWTSAENFLYSDHSPYIGIEAVRHLLFVRLHDDWESCSATAGEILGGGDLVIANGRFRGIFKANGASIDAQFVQVFQFKDGKISKCQMYTDTASFKESISQIRSTEG